MSDTHNDPRADAAEHPAVDSNSVDDSVGEPMQVDTEGTVSPPTPPNTYLRANLLLQGAQTVEAMLAEPSWGFNQLARQPLSASQEVILEEMATHIDDDEDSAVDHAALTAVDVEGTVGVDDTEEVANNAVIMEDQDNNVGEQETGEGDSDNNNEDDDQDTQVGGQPPQVPHDDHFIDVDRRDVVNESPDCKLCMTTPGPDEVALYVECGHIWCKDCLNQYFAQTFTDRDQFPPRCCRPEGFNLEVIGMYLEDEVLMHVMDKWEEWTATNPTYCANADCNLFVPEDRV